MKLYPSITDRRQDSWKGILDFQKKLGTGTWEDQDRPAGSLSVSKKKKKKASGTCVCSELRAGLVDRMVGKGSPVRVARH